MRVFITQFLGAIAYLVVLIFVGAAGYVAIEGRPWREALYILVIERDPQRLERIHEHYPEVLTVFGDATLDENLRESGILKGARTVVVSERRYRQRVRLSLGTRPRPRSHDRCQVPRRGKHGQARRADTRLDIGDEMIVVGHPDQVAKLPDFAQA